MHRSMTYIVIVAIFFQYVFGKSAVRQQKELVPTCASKIYCQGQLLDVIQMSKPHKDSKTFVDMSMRFSPEEVLKNFDNMMKSTSSKPSKDNIAEFLKKNFAPEGTELEDWTPSDYAPNPHFLQKIHKTRVRKFAQKVVEIWPQLGRKVKEKVKQNPDRYSLIYVPNGFIIPGGRFREFYYWDSYWIIRGLLLSEMYATVVGMLNNFIYMVKEHGFVPNGGRIYYLNRSQPPLLMKMAMAYLDATNDLTWLKKNIDTLEKECTYWFDRKFTTVKVGGKEYKMARYIADSAGPRPEAYVEDVLAAGIYEKQEDKQKVYNELKAAAFSGWDFSTRWIFDKSGGVKGNISYTATTRFIPVDLNAILYGAFFDLSHLYSTIGNETEWGNRAAELKKAIEKVLWDDEDGIWYDFDIVLGTKRKMFVASNLTPLWTKAYDLSQKETIGSKVAKYLSREGVTGHRGGIPATKVNSDQQWDMPNAWPPLQYIIVYGLLETEEKEAMAIAKNILRWWVTANIRAFELDGVLYEKYDAVNVGQYGGGGEYANQAGFGWTNGVVLDFINLFYSIGGGKMNKSFHVLLCCVSLALVITN